MFPSSRFTSRLYHTFTTSTSISKSSHSIHSLTSIHRHPCLYRSIVSTSTSTSTLPTSSPSTSSKSSTPTPAPIDPKAARRAARTSAAIAKKLNLVTVQERSVIINDLAGIKPDMNMFARFGPRLTPAVLPDETERTELSQALSYQTANSAELASARYQTWMLKYGRFVGDTGSTAVQIAILSDRLRTMKSHILRRNTDMRARYDLNLIYQRRRRLCFYLRKQDMALYARVMQDFEIDERELELQGKIWELDPRLASKAYQNRTKRNKKRERMRK